MVKFYVLDTLILLFLLLLFHPTFIHSSAMPYDPTSQSNLDQVKTNHIHLDLSVDFAAKALSGSAELEIEAIADHVNTLVLDTSFIDVKAVSAAGKTLQVLNVKHPTTMGWDTCIPRD